jgi:hypothetical protein
MLDDESSRCTLRPALGLLLESFARSYRYVPDRATTITDPDALPDRLRPLTESLPPLATWRAWVDEPRLWFIIARLSEERRQWRDLVLLEMLFVSVDGEPVAAGCWGLSAQGRWVLRCIEEPEKVRIAPRSFGSGARRAVSR